MKKILLITLFLSVGFSQQLIPFVETYDNGNIESITYHKKSRTGIEKVKYEKYYENGQKLREETYKDGIKDGKWTYWYENGQKESEVTYKNGKEDGKWTVWHNNGEKSKEVTYKDGVKNGKWTEWYENGQIKEEGTSMRGKSYIGSWEKQIEEEEFITLSFFENGTFTVGEDEVNGIYTISDNKITFIDDECGEEEGVYSYLITSIISAFDSSGNERVIRGQQLTFILISDGCNRNEFIPAIWTKK